MGTEILQQVHEGLEATRSVGLRYTRQAYQMLPALRSPRILDVGCGPGTATMELARLSGGQVVGLDIDRAALAALSRGIGKQGLAGQVQAVLGSMSEISFLDGSFDVVWAEGALHFMGFGRALRAWRRLIKPNGYLVVHEMAWLRPDPPQAIAERWQPVFPEISTVAGYIAGLGRHGYRLVGHFSLPESFWWANYYALLQERIGALREKYAGEGAILQILNREQREVDLFRKHQRWYGSAFLVTQVSRDDPAVTR
jgi:SAM-dependent methyltransferase